MKHLFHFSSYTVLLCLVCACGQNHHDPGERAVISDRTAEFVQSEAPPSIPESDKITGTAAVRQRKIIKEGTINFETANAEKTRADIVKSVNENDGYLADDNISNYAGNTHYRITVRIPAGKFDILLEQISGAAKRIDNKEIKALDVTEQFVDVEARIKAKKEIEGRYKELLRQAHNVNDILSIEREIGLLRTDIESFEGRLQYLNDRVAYSTLTLVFYEKRESAPTSFGFGEKISDALYDGWINALWLTIGLANVWPYILIIIAIIFAVRHFRRKRKMKNKAGGTDA